jgi:hypothetical protein
VRRLRLLGKVFLLIGCVGMIASYVGSWLFPVEFNALRQSSILAILLPWLTEFVFLGVVALCGAWVVEGFVSKGD